MSFGKKHLPNWEDRWYSTDDHWPSNKLILQKNVPWNYQLLHLNFWTWMTLWMNLNMNDLMNECEHEWTWIPNEKWTTLIFVSSLSSYNQCMGVPFKNVNFLVRTMLINPVALWFIFFIQNVSKCLKTQILVSCIIQGKKKTTQNQTKQKLNNKL